MSKPHWQNIRRLLAATFSEETLRILCYDEPDFWPVYERLSGRSHKEGVIVGQLAMLTASAQPLADLCRASGLVSPFYNIFSQTRLGLLVKADWQALVTSNMEASQSDLTFIETMAGGQPFFTQRAAGHLWGVRAEGAVDYQQPEAELSRQMAPHLRQLWSKLAAVEQHALRSLAGLAGYEAEERVLAALERRGVVAGGRIFSRVFEGLIRAGNFQSPTSNPTEVSQL